ncbi:MAG: caspase family protein, partial [Cyanobacteria bacterium P01_H01_bin.121]
MSENWAITIGINNYRYLRSLSYAVCDADSLHELFKQELLFNRLYHFTDTSRPIIADYGKPLYSTPIFTSLKRFFDVRFQQSFLSEEDNLWFFFAGHGARDDGQDYLIPSDGYLANLADTAIPVRYVRDRLRRSGAGNIILLMDACRSSASSRHGVGFGTETQQGVITLYACSPGEYSYEIKALQQGAFTHVLLTSLRLSGEANCATVERLHDRLRSTVPQLTLRHGLAPQTPYCVIEPSTKRHLILLPKLATKMDVVKLTELALKAEIRQDWPSAKQFWSRILAVPESAPEVRADAIEGISRIAKQEVQPTPESATLDHGAAASKSATNNPPTPSPPVQSGPVRPDIKTSIASSALELQRIEPLPMQALVSDR